LLGNRVDRFEWNGTSLVFDQNLTMLRAFQNDAAPLPAGQGDAAQPPLGNHDGGVITFGNDGKLYIIIGDVGRRGQLQNLPSGPTETGLGPTVPDDQFGGPEPDDAHFTGVIIRLNDDGTTPADNPFFDVGDDIGGEVGANIQQIFAYGIRNSFGLAIDPFTGRVWNTENGDDSFDELNLVQPGFNSGWIQVMGPLARLDEFKNIETTFGSQSLQQLRWPPERIADSPEEALDRLFELEGSRYSDPEFSWKFAVPPTALDFVQSRALGGKYFGDLIVGNGAGQLMDFDMTGRRFTVKAGSRGLRDRVDDNSVKFVANESQRLVIGEGFGIITDVEAGPGGSLFVSSIEHGTVYEVFRIPTRSFGTRATGTQEVPPRDTRASGNMRLNLSRNSDVLFFQLSVSNIRNVVAAHLHLADVGVNGPIVVSLFMDEPGGGPSRGLLARGSIRSEDLEGPLAGHSLDELIGLVLDGDIYLNVHTNDGVGEINTGPGDFPGGEIRGQIRARRS
jgi:glucose/arabinose dehydrogenase